MSSSTKSPVNKFLFIFTCLTGLVILSVNSIEPVNDYRLPLNLKPQLYHVQLRPYIGPPETYGNKSFSTEGTVVIHFSCEIPTNKIYLHARELEIHVTSLKINDTGLGVVDLEFDVRRDFVIVNLNGMCQTGHHYALSLAFTGIVSHTFGLYRSAYKDSTDNQTFQ